MTASSSRTGIAIVLALALGSTRASAEEVRAPVDAAAPATEHRVVVVPVRVQGELAPRVREDIDARLRSSIADDAKLLQRTEPASCSDPECWRSLVGDTGATRLVQATIVVIDRDYDLRCDVIDASSGAVVASASQRCEICGYDELGDTVEALGTALQRKLHTQVTALPVLAVTSTPSGAMVTVDGESVGVTPMHMPLAEGSHDVRVHKAGHVAQLRRVTLVAGVREPVDVTLAPAPTAERESSVPRKLRTGAGVALGLGVAALGVGIGLAVLDEAPIRSRCSGDNVDITGRCKYRYDTMAGGITALAVGAALVATGIALLVVARKKGRASNVAWRVRGSGLAFRF